jgi:hypothetical protein
MIIVMSVTVSFAGVSKNQEFYDWLNLFEWEYCGTYMKQIKEKL